MKGRFWSKIGKISIFSQKWSLVAQNYGGGCRRKSTIMDTKIVDYDK